MSGLPEISAHELSDLIGAIYDCSLDPQLWPAACRRIAAKCESMGGGICVHDLSQARNDQLFVFGYEQEFLIKLGGQYADSPMAASDVLANVGDVSALSMERFQLLDSHFYRDVLQPHGVLDMLWFPALRTGSRMASMHASRGDTLQPYRTEDIKLFELLAPHVCRALAISDALDIRVLRSEVLERTLDGLAAGVFLTASDGQVVYMNAAAERQAKSGNAIRIVNNRLSPIHPGARAAMDLAIRSTAQDGLHLAGKEHSIAIPGLTNGGAVATLLPVADGQRAGVLAPFAAAVAVFIQDHAEAPLMPGEAFGRLYGLTGGELRVAMALSQGLSGMECAQMLGVGEPTVRTHLQKIFVKTETTRQADLLRLMHQSTPPMRRQLDRSA